MDHPVFISVYDSASFIQQEAVCVWHGGRRLVQRNTCKPVVQVHPLLVTYSSFIISIVIICKTFVIQAAVI